MMQNYNLHLNAQQSFTNGGHVGTRSVQHQNGSPQIMYDMPIRDDGNKPHSALVEKYTNREYSSLIKKSAEP